MAEKTQTVNINLLPNESDSFMMQFFNWLLLIGRLLIFVTYIIALATFLYRFTLDQQMVNFHDKINSESFILDNFQSAEDTFIDIQDRLTAIQHYSTIGTRTLDIFKDITKMGQGVVTFKDVTVNTQNIIIEMQASTPAPLTQFVNALKNYPLVTSISVDKVATNPSDAQITAVVTAKLKQAPFAESELQTESSANQSILNTQ